MIKTTKAAVLEATGKPLAIREIEIPDLLAGQVLVKVLYSGVCRSQLMEVRGLRGEDKWLPHLLGHEASGIVMSIGSNITKVKVGDEVILGWMPSEGIDAPGAKYRCGDQIINSGKVTTFSNYTVVSENRVVIKPGELSFDQATLFGCALPTGAGIVMNQLKPEAGSSIGIIGLGGIGISALMTLKEYACAKVIAIDVSDEKLALAKELWATHTLNPIHDNVIDEVLKLTNGGLDYCIESAGRCSTIELGFSIIRRGGGKLIFASHPPENERISIAPFELICGKKIEGSWGGGVRPDVDVPKIHNLLTKSEAPLHKLVERVYTLEQINDALEDMELGRVVRPIIKMEHPHSQFFPG